MKQKRCFAINDISGVGRCSLSAMLPIVAMFDIECINIPTAVLSTSTQYSDFVMKDLSDYVGKYLNHYKNLGLNIDGCFVGFLGNYSVVDTLLNHFKETKYNLLFVDPIMGDNGELYATYDQKLVDGVRALCMHADLITPNLTEFCALCCIDYDSEITDERIIEECYKLGVKKIVVSGLERDNKIGNLIFDNGNVSSYYREKTCMNRSGTGDVFASVIYGSLLHGLDLNEAVIKASDFVYEAILRSQELVNDYREGLAFEGILGTLWKDIWQKEN